MTTDFKTAPVAELRRCLLTCDGRGVEYKTAALNELFRRQCAVGDALYAVVCRIVTTVKEGASASDDVAQTKAAEEMAEAMVGLMSLAEAYADMRAKIHHGE